MFSVFEKYLRDKIILTENDIRAMRATAIEKKIRKHQFLLQEGDVSRYKSFVTKGLLKSYRVSNTGEEHILLFAPEHWWIGDMESYNTGQPSLLNIDAIEDSEVIMWTKENFEELLHTIPSWNALREKLVMRSFDASQNRIYSNISRTAEEKYNIFLETYPHIASRVPLHMIASYLGVARETLTRIRNQAGPTAKK